MVLHCHGVALSRCRCCRIVGVVTLSVLSCCWCCHVVGVVGVVSVVSVVGVVVLSLSLPGVDSFVMRIVDTDMPRVT